MIIDVHGHYTTAPAGARRLARPADRGAEGSGAGTRRVDLKISDDELRESIETNQLTKMDERGTDLTIFSPRASFMAHHIGDFQTSSTWAAICNELCSSRRAAVPRPLRRRRDAAAVARRRSGDLHPRAGACVREYGFVGINLNPDPSGGHWTSPPLTDRHWYPLYEKMVEHDIPAMIHVATSCNPASTRPARTTSTPTRRRSCSA